MVKTAGVLTSCKRINSKRTIASESTASEPLQANHCKRTTASESLQANHCERITASESLRGKQGRKKAGKEGKYT